MKFLNHLRIRTRLLGAFSITVLITLLIGLLGMSSTANQASSMSSMYDNQLVPIADVSNANMQAIYINRNLYNYVIAADTASKDKLKALIAQRLDDYKALFTKYQATELAAEEKQLIGKIEGAWPAYRTASDKAMKLSDEGRMEDAIAVVNGEAAASFKIRCNNFNNSVGCSH